MTAVPPGGERGRRRARSSRRRADRSSRDASPALASAVAGGAAVQRAGRAVVQRVDGLISVGGPAFRTLALGHAASTAGDTLVAIALAQSLFFAVPSTEARGNVALYLLLTVAPFALIGPVLGRLLDRRGSGRIAFTTSALLRAIGCGVLVWQFRTLWLFPLAFALLVLSRVHGISRSALLPMALDQPLALVAANARLAQVGVAAGALVAPLGALAVALGGATAAMGLAVAVFVVATIQGLRLPSLEGLPVELQGTAGSASMFDRAAGTAGGTPGVRVGVRVDDPTVALDSPTLRLDPRADPGGPVHGHADASRQASGSPEGVERSDGDVGRGLRGRAARRARRRARLPRHVRLAQLATAVVRLLNGFLLLLLAFAFRGQDAPLLDFGAVLGAAGAGFGLAALLAPPLERRLREEPMVVAGLAVEAAAAFIAAQWFGLGAAAVLALAAGFGWGTAKFAFDGLLQANVEAPRRGQAFTRSETVFQLAWVLGAFLPTGINVPVEVGLVGAGLAALAAQTVYVARLLERVGSPAT